MIDPATLERQRAALSRDRTAPSLRPKPTNLGTPMTDNLCPRCNTNRLAVRNKIGVCYLCWSYRLTNAERTANQKARRVRA